MMCLSDRSTFLARLVTVLLFGRLTRTRRIFATAFLLEGLVVVEEVLSLALSVYLQLLEMP